MMLSAGLMDNAPFFIVCDARSGSTFLADRLAQRAAIAITPETNFVPALIDAYAPAALATQQQLDAALNIIFSEHKFSDLRLDRSAVKHLVADRLPVGIGQLVLAVLRCFRDTHAPRATHCGIKKGSYVMYHRAIRAALPSTRFVCLIRDGRGVYNSKKKSLYSVTGKPFETDPVAAAQTWRTKVEQIQCLEQEGQSAIVIHYEDLIRDTEGVMDRILLFLGVHEPVASNGPQSYCIPARYGTVLHGNVARRPLPDRIDAWREELTAEEIATFEAIAGSTLVKAGYDLINRPQSGGRSNTHSGR